jgi:hypothetical protein
MVVSTVEKMQTSRRLPVTITSLSNTHTPGLAS